MMDMFVSFFCQLASVLGPRDKTLNELNEQK
jgi:hypothetical protein